MNVFNDLCLQHPSPIDRGIQIVELEPHEDPVTVPPTIGIDEVRMVFRVPCVELKHQCAVYHEPIVEVVVIRSHELAGARGAQECRVPTCARTHVAHSEQGLGPDSRHASEDTFYPR